MGENVPEIVLEILVFPLVLLESTVIFQGIGPSRLLLKGNHEYPLPFAAVRRFVIWYVKVSAPIENNISNGCAVPETFN